MKRISQQIISIYMLILFLCLGTGFNVYNYCCKSCENVGSNIFTTISCEEVHDKHLCEDNHCHHVPAMKPIPADCDRYSSYSDHCSVQRYTITQSYTPVQTLQSVQLPLITNVPFVQYALATERHSTLQSTHRKIPHRLSSGRNVLLASSILII